VARVAAIQALRAKPGRRMGEESRRRLAGLQAALEGLSVALAGVVESEPAEARLAELFEAVERRLAGP
jgi:hypothetical protein